MSQSLFFCALLFVSDGGSNAQLPNASELRQRVVANMRNAAARLENYSCQINTMTQRMDGGGNAKSTEKQQSERFYVNGFRVDHVLAKNGVPLKGAQAREEQDRTDKQVRKYSDARQAEKLQEEREKQFDVFVRAQRLVNGRREERGGRSILIYDLAADTSFRPRNIEERFAQAVGGRIWIDEQSGAPIELKIQTTRDVRIGGGFLANLHKGFELHLLRERQPDGLWLTKTLEGNADVRAGLFFHPRIRFREATSNCHLFSVDSHDVKYGDPEPGVPATKATK